MFVRVVQTGSFSAAARNAGTTQSSVSKTIAALEAHLGSQLLMRNSRALSLTEAGRAYYERIQPILEDFLEAETAVRGTGSSLKATLRVSMSPVLSRLVFAPIMSDFLARHPECAMSLELTERHCDVVAEGIDVVVRATELEDSSLVARRLSKNPLMLAAAPAYLTRNGEPKHPNELTRHNCLIFGRLGTRRKWRLIRGDQDLSVHVRGNVECDQGDSLAELAASGCGITMMPRWVMRQELEDGRLQPVLPRWRSPSLPLHIVYPKTKHMPVKTRRFIDFVCAEIRRRRALPP
jgi:DNA-binding transcriptional LysR family regulator